MSKIIAYGEDARKSLQKGIDQLADTVMKGMEEYAKLAAEDLKKDVQKAGKTVKQQIESTAPKKTGKYSKSWAVKKTRETSDSFAFWDSIPQGLLIRRMFSSS